MARTRPADSWNRGEFHLFSGKIDFSKSCSAITEDWFFTQYTPPAYFQQLKSNMFADKP